MCVDKKMKIRHIITLILALSSLQYSCEDKDEPPMLPPSTQAGKDSFGMLVDGDVWVPMSKSYLGTNIVGPSLGYDIGDSTLVIMAAGKGYIKFSSLVSDTGTYTINRKYIDYFSFYDSTIVDTSSSIFNTFFWYESDSFFIDDMQNQTIIIRRFDLENRIISGEFHMNLKSDDGGEVKITEGRFDSKVYTYP